MFAIKKKEVEILAINGVELKRSMANGVFNYEGKKEAKAGDKLYGLTLPQGASEVYERICGAKHYLYGFNEKRGEWRSEVIDKEGQTLLSITRAFEIGWRGTIHFTGTNFTSEQEKKAQERMLKKFFEMQQVKSDIELARENKNALASLAPLLRLGKLLGDGKKK